MTCSLKIVVMSVVLSTGLLGVEPPRYSHPVHHARKAPVIDGKLDEACWKKSKLVQAFHPHGEKGEKAEPPSLTARYAWDERYLFIGYEVNDSSLVAIGTGKEDGPPKNRRPQSVEYLPNKNLDLVEFFISFGSNRFFWEIHHNAANHLNDLWIELPTAAELAKIPKPSYKHITFHRDRYVGDEDSFTVKRAVRLRPKAGDRPSSINDANDVDTGYTGEIRLPWAGLGAPKKFRKPNGEYSLGGKRLPILAVVLNGNNGQAKYHSSGSNLLPLMYHYSTKLWPLYELVD